jgi:hypothetical protein
LGEAPSDEARSDEAPLHEAAPWDEPGKRTPARPTAQRAASRTETVEPLRAGRYKVQFTASTALREKLERLQALMRASGKEASLAATIEPAVEEKLERLEAKRLGLSRKPRKTVAQSDRAPHSRHVPAAVRRTVWKRDQGRCGFVDAEGRRCTAVSGLEFHHHHPYGLGGVHSVGNTALRCRLHNGYLAELDYGRRTPPTSQRPQTNGASG